MNYGVITALVAVVALFTGLGLIAFRPLGKYDTGAACVGLALVLAIASVVILIPAGL